MGEVENAGRAAEDSEWLDHAVRFGLVAYGVVHLLIAWLALSLALGEREGAASGTGALKELAQEPFGLASLWAVAIGMLLLVLWRVLEAGFGHRDKDGASRTGKRLLSLFKALVYGALGLTAIKTAVGEKTGGGEDTLTAQLLALPFGTALVWLLAAAIAGYGVFQIVIGWTEKFAKHLDAEGNSGKAGSAYRLFGKFGYIGKGLAVLPVAGLFAFAAATSDADKSGGLDVALRKVLQQPLGPWLVGAVAVGLAAYGLFCFARARHLNR